MKTFGNLISSFDFDKFKSDYIILDTVGNLRLFEVAGNEITKKETLAPPPHEPGVLPGFIIEVPASLLPVE